MKPTSDPARILRELVAIPSVHPEADVAGSIAGERALANWVRDYLGRLGADVRCSLLAPGRPTVLGEFAPTGKPIATVAFAPHLDTVGVAGMTVPPFRLTTKRGRLYGRGACDTKGPMAALLAALTQWTQSPAARAGRTRWIFAATAGEEQGSLGARALLQHGFKADFAVALEPTELRVVYAAKGLLRVWIEVPGRSAHGSTPDRGVNAVYRALPLVRALQRDFTRFLSRRPHPVLGHGTSNLGLIQGGDELNIVPGQCRIGLDIRLHPEQTPARVLEYLDDLVATHTPGAKIIVHREGPAFMTARTDDWAARLRRVGRGWDTANWFCDANIFSGGGIPSVAFGPGSIAQAHTKDEFIAVRELQAGAAAFRKFLAT